ncbi:MAG TPA: ZIP family metal transporter [Chitinophagales bacterium]|nr:ZIP family metal transporter [Chitinophagales bacterium]
MNSWSLILLFAAPLLGGLAALLFRKQAEANYKLVLSFSGAFLFTIILIHLFPTVFKNTPNAGLFVLIGFFIQILLEQLTHGIEHGHFHAHEHSGAYITPLIVGLSLHSFLDGIPLSSNQLMEETHHALLYGISIHKIPEGFALASILIISNYKSASIGIYLVLFSLVAPAAVLLGNYFQEYQTTLLNSLIAVALGSFLHVSTTILFESENKAHRFGWQRIGAIVLGGGLAFLFS